MWNRLVFLYICHLFSSFVSKMFSRLFGSLSIKHINYVIMNLVKNWPLFLVIQQDHSTFWYCQIWQISDRSWKLDAHPDESNTQKFRLRTTRPKGKILAWAWQSDAFILIYHEYLNPLFYGSAKVLCWAFFVVKVIYNILYIINN